MPTEEKKKKIVNRLRTIQGHISGIEKMIEEDRPCEDILVQVGAIRSSISRVGMVILEDYAKECILLESEDVDQDALDRVIGMLLNYTKT
jgi:DNA-binding FrmR family transcriptional regulator